MWPHCPKVNTCTCNTCIKSCVSMPSRTISCLTALLFWKRKYHGTILLTATPGEVLWGWRLKLPSVVQTSRIRHHAAARLRLPHTYWDSLGCFFWQSCRDLRRRSQLSLDMRSLQHGWTWDHCNMGKTSKFRRIFQKAKITIRSDLLNNFKTSACSPAPSRGFAFRVAFKNFKYRKKWRQAEVQSMFRSSTLDASFIIWYANRKTTVNILICLAFNLRSDRHHNWSFRPAFVKS